MRDVPIGALLLVGVALVAIGLHGIWSPLAYLWLGLCCIFPGWRLVVTR